MKYCSYGLYLTYFANSSHLNKHVSFIAIDMLSVGLAERHILEQTCEFPL
jgi:hypothetical protein